jgi:hypothetical protein
MRPLSEQTSWAWWFVTELTGGIGRRMEVQGLPWRNSRRSLKKVIANRDGGIVEPKGLSFNPQYHQKLKHTTDTELRVS